MQFECLTAKLFELITSSTVTAADCFRSLIGNRFILIDIFNYTIVITVVNQDSVVDIIGYAPNGLTRIKVDKSGAFDKIRLRS